MDGGETYGAVSKVSAANEAATREALEPHLEPGDTIEELAGVRPKGGKWSTVWGPRVEVTPADVELPDLVAIGVTLTRLLLVSQPPRNSGEASALLYSAPLEAVGSVQIAKVRGAKEVSWTAEGRQYRLSTNGRFIRQFAEALQLKPLSGA